MRSNFARIEIIESSLDSAIYATVTGSSIAPLFIEAEIPFFFPVNAPIYKCSNGKRLGCVRARRSFRLRYIFSSHANTQGRDGSGRESLVHASETDARAVEILYFLQTRQERRILKVIQI